MKCDCGSKDIAWWRASVQSNAGAMCRDCGIVGNREDFKTSLLGEATEESMGEEV